MARLKIWSDEVELRSKLPIDITMPKAYVLANTPFNEDHWTRTFTTKTGHVVVARATQKLPLSRNIDLKIEARSSLDNVEYETIIEKIEYELGLHETMRVFKNLKKSDTLIDFALHSNPGFRLFANSEAIETAILTIISQNTSFFNYIVIVENMLNKYGRKVPWDPSLYVFPDKRQLAQMLEKDWLSLKLGYKSKFLGSLTEDTLEKIETYSFYPVLKRGLDGLKEIKGIGNYTARILAIYHSRRYDYAFYDTYVLEVLNHKYEIGNINNIKQFDDWVNNKWPQDPALVIHSLLLEHLPEYLKSHQTFYSRVVKTEESKMLSEEKSLKKMKQVEKTKIKSALKKTAEMPPMEKPVAEAKKVVKKSIKKKTTKTKKESYKATQQLLEKLTKKTLEDSLHDYVMGGVMGQLVQDPVEKEKDGERIKTSKKPTKNKKMAIEKPVKKKLPTKKQAKKKLVKRKQSTKPKKKATKKSSK